jgi:hypothetical protein
MSDENSLLIITTPLQVYLMEVKVFLSTTYIFVS